MWQTRMDMSRDECRKCLRCLELDAYGNMVSVLRAQGPYTEDKKRLLEELAKVLHISNERHRAEVRRAANDEKLSIIAEQLNGPNTWTDWAIEGRRTIPLLPRLKAHTAFTGLANSLSLVIATANEKKVPFEEKRPEPIVKAETESHKDLVQPETKNFQKPQLPQPKIRGRKRKKSLPETTQDVRNPKLATNDMDNHGAIISTIINDLSSELRTSPSPLPSEATEDLEKSPEIPKKCTELPDNKIYNNESKKTTICQLEINRTPETAITITNYEDNGIIPEHLSPEENSHSLKSDDVEKIKDEVDRINIGEIKEGLLSTSNALNVQRIMSTNCQTIYPVISSCLERIEEISEDNSESSGSGPIEGEGEMIKTNNSKVETLNNQSRMKEDIKLNSNIRDSNSSRLISKTNIIMVQKVDLQKIPNNKDKVPNANLKPARAVVLNIRQDELDLDNHNEDSIEPVDDMKTNSIDSIDEQSNNNDNHGVNIEEIEERYEDLITEDNEQSNDISGDNCVEETIEITEEAVSGEILIEHDNETVLIDAQTEIFNFESTDENVCEIQIEETVPASTLELFTTSEEITIDNYTYEEETEVLDDNLVLNQLDS